MDARPPALNKDLLPEGFIPFAFPGLPGVGCAFGTASAGNMSLEVSLDEEGLRRTRAARRSLLRLLAAPEWTELQQVHGDVLLVDPPATPTDEPSGLEADGAATALPGRALVIKTADCQPVLLAHKGGGHIAALHVGWRGNTLDFPASGVRAFCRAYGLSPADLLAVRGPSLGPGAAEFVNFEREWPERFRPWFSPESRTMDLWSLTRHGLEAAGLLRQNIFGLDLCTASLSGSFFSYRRGDNARQASLIWIRKPAWPTPPTP